jgi:hypothetical protein
MATSSQMLLAGIAFFVNTFVIIVSAIWGGAVWKPLMTWYFSVPYNKAPPLDPGIVTWIPSLYFAVLGAIWFALLGALIFMSINRREYG